MVGVINVQHRMPHQHTGSEMEVLTTVGEQVGCVLVLARMAPSAMESANHVELVLGEARFVGPKTVEVRLNGGGTRLISGDKVFLNLGTRPFLPPVPGLTDVALTNIDLLELDHVPPHLVILGGSYVGLEFAQAYRRFGSKVTVVERNPQLLDKEDPDAAAVDLEEREV